MRYEVKSLWDIIKGTKGGPKFSVNNTGKIQIFSI